MLHEAVNGYIKANGRSKGARLALIPSGSDNDFYRSFRNYPSRSPSRILVSHPLHSLALQFGCCTTAY